MKNFLPRMSVMLFILCFGLLSFTTLSEEPIQRIERHIILLKIQKINGFEEAGKIDTEMSTKDGILTSRTNPETGVYFCFASLEKDLKEEDFIKWFKELGYSISCFTKIVEGEDTVDSFKEVENCEL